MQAALRSTVWQINGRSVFIIGFLGSVIIQSILWTFVRGIDEVSWLQAVHSFVIGTPIDETHPAYGYPGTTLLLCASILAHVGLPEVLSLYLSIIFLTSVAVGAATAVAYTLRPLSMWWILVAVSLIITPQYVKSTFPTALLAPLVALLALLVLMAREQGFSPKVTAGIGLCLGAMLATRFDFSSLYACGTMIYILLIRKDWRATVTAGSVMFATFAVLDPYIWWAPFEHVNAILQKIFLHADKTAANGTGSTFEMLVQAPVIGVLSFVLTAILLLLHRHIGTIPKDFSIWLVGVTMTIVIAIFLSHHHPPWLFFPAFLGWTIFLPLLLIESMNQNTVREGPRFKVTPEALGGFLIGAFLTYQILSLVFQISTSPVIVIPHIA